MKKTIIVLVSTFICSLTIAQNFEGIIIYKNSFKSKSPNVTDMQFEQMMGSREEFYIKNGDYKSVRNGTFYQWSLYVNKENKFYSKLSNSDTLYWDDAGSNTDTVLKVEVNREAINILGYKCDELILTCKNGIQKHYFNSKLHVDPNLYVKHKFANWYDYLLKSQSLPLKSIVEYEQFILEMVATEVKEMKLSESFFDLPINSKSKKNPYQ